MSIFPLQRTSVISTQSQFIHAEASRKSQTSLPSRYNLDRISSKATPSTFFLILLCFSIPSVLLWLLLQKLGRAFCGRKVPKDHLLLSNRAQKLLASFPSSSQGMTESARNREIRNLNLLFRYTKTNLKLDRWNKEMEALSKKAAYPPKKELLEQKLALYRKALEDWLSKLKRSATQKSSKIDTKGVERAVHELLTRWSLPLYLTHEPSCEGLPSITPKHEETSAFCTQLGIPIDTSSTTYKELHNLYETAHSLLRHIPVPQSEEVEFVDWTPWKNRVDALEPIAKLGESKNLLSFYEKNPTWLLFHCLVFLDEKVAELSKGVPLSPTSYFALTALLKNNPSPEITYLHLALKKWVAAIEQKAPPNSMEKLVASLSEKMF